MSEPIAIAGMLSGFRTLADGTLRATIDFNESEGQEFLRLFTSIHQSVALAPLLPNAVSAEGPVPPERDSNGHGEHGDYAKALWLSAFFGVPEVLYVCGSDTQFRAWVRTQKCSARSGGSCEGEIQAAHVWRLKADFGKGVKGDYWAVPLCVKHHQLQHSEGEGAVFGSRDLMEKARHDYVRKWIWERIKTEIGVISMRDADPALIRGWAAKKGLDRYLPNAA